MLYADVIADFSQEICSQISDSLILLCRSDGKPAGESVYNGARECGPTYM